MKCTCNGILMLLAFISTLSALAFSMTLELHRLPKHNIHSDRYMRRLSTEDGMMELVPLHLGFGTHYTWVYAGTPPQRASVIVDTGSAFMAFPCSDCDGCGNHTDQPFAAKNSSTLVYVPCAELSSFRCKDCGVTSNTCTVSQTYQEGSSWKATVVEDVVYLGGDSSFEDMTMRDQYGTYFQFGCQKSETGLFLTQVADGIMGLSNTGKHIVAKLHRENKILSNLFSLCFLENGGTMSIGQPHLSAHRGEISYAKVLSDRSAGEFYDVHVKDVRIGGKSINASEEAFIRGHFIVDSGTTDSYLPRLLQTEFMAMFKEVSGRDYRVGDSCRGYTNDDLASLPSIQLVMEAHGDGNGEVVLNIPPEQYLTKMNGAFCSSLYLTENSGGVIGANLMMNRDVIFDISNQRVGFVDADCAYQGDRNSTADLSASNKTTNISEGKEKGTVTIVGVPSATSTVDTPAPIVGAVPTVPTSVATDISAPIAGAVPTAPTSVATDISSPTAGAVPTATTPAAIISKPVATAESTSALVPVATEPTTTAGATPLTAVVTNSSALNNVSSIADSQIEPLSGQTTMVPTSSSSAAMGDSKSKEKLSGTHPVVLSVVGTILVVGFLVMLLISVSRRRQKAAKDQLWSRVKSDEENEEDDDEEEFGLVHHHDKKQPSIKHERLDREEDEEDHASSSSKEEEDDEVFDLKPIQEESTVVDNAIEEYSMMKLQLHTKQQSRSEQTRARRRALDDIDKGDTDFVSGEFALSESYLGVGYGTHYAEMYLGIPAQRASVIVDTGSHFTALPCITCNDCGKHTDPPYNVSKSTTATYLACNDFDSCRSCEQERCYVNQNYVEGSMWQAVMIDELIWLGGLASLSDEVEGVMKTFGFRFPVGCQTKETGLFVTQQENGIMGLGRHHSTVMSYMLKAGRVKHDIFTLCFAGDGGELTFGGVDYSHHTSGVSYTPLLNEHSVTYLVHVRDILVNGVSLGIDEKTINSGKGVIVDSGTTDTFFDAGGNRRFMKAFRHAAGGRDYSEKVMKLSQDELARLPVISIVLSGMKGDGSDDIQLDVPASKYLISSHDGVSYYGNLHFSERSGGVLGASVMIGLDVIFDAENQRVGFAESHCGKAHVNTISESPDTVDPFISKTAAPNASIAIGETNGSNVSSSNSLAVVLMNPTATPVPDNATVGSIDPTTSSSADVTTQRESPNFDVSTAEAILILLVSVALGVIVWTKWRMRTWSRIPNYTSRAHMETILHSNETTSQPLSSGAEESLLSPRSRAAKIIQSSKFINGSSEEEDDDDDE